MYRKLPIFIVVAVIAVNISPLESSPISPTFTNSKFLDPNLTDAENLQFLRGNTTGDTISRNARSTETRKTQDPKTFGFLPPLFGMWGHMSAPSNSYSSQYNIPGSTQVSHQGYTVPLFNYPFYNYFYGRGQGRIQN